MKKLFLLLAVCSIFGSSLYAQSGKMTEERRKEFDAQKIAFFTQQLELTPEEAALFWPLYNEMQKEQRALEIKIRNTYHQVETMKEGTVEKCTELLDMIFEYEQQKIEVKKNCYHQMIKVIPILKVGRIAAVERMFHRHLFNKLGKISHGVK